MKFLIKLSVIIPLFICCAYGHVIKANTKGNASIEYFGDGEIKTFCKNELILSNPHFKIVDCHSFLNGKQFLYNSVEFRVINSGMLFLLAPYDEEKIGPESFPERTQFKELESKLGLDITGFMRIDIEPFNLFGNKSTQLWAIYSKEVIKGQNYRFGKDVVVFGFESAIHAESVPWNKNTGELLYNGIRLPENWPPIDIGYSINPADHEPMAVPYLDYPPEVIPIDVGRQLFFDDFLIEQTDLTRVFHKPVKYDANPILKPETELEINANGKTGAAVTVPKSGCVCWDPEDCVFKMWYEAGWLGTIAYAISKDGINWQRPQLDIVSGTNQVLPIDLNPDSWTIVRDWNSSDPQKKWTLYMQPPVGGAGTGWSLTSPDGIHWTQRTPTGIAGDRSTHFYNPFRQKWVYSLRISRRENVLNRSRLYYECDDFLEGAFWSDVDVFDWLYTDLNDPGDYLIGERPQLYNFDAVAYESIMLGFFQILQGPTNGVCNAAGLPKITELMFAYSRDGFHWHRPDRHIHIPAERKDVWDRGYVQSVGNICIIQGDKLWFYYIGFQGNELKAGQNGYYDRGSTGVAFLRRDGFASLEAKEDSGILTTRPVVFSGKYLFVNTDTSKGQLRAEITDLNGNPIFPFTFDNSIPFSGDSTLVQLRWHGGSDLSKLSNHPVRIRFMVKNGSLYAFWVSPKTDGRSNGYIAGGGPGYTGPVDTVGKAALIVKMGLK